MFSVAPYVFMCSCVCVRACVCVCVCVCMRACVGMQDVITCEVHSSLVSSEPRGLPAPA